MTAAATASTISANELFRQRARAEAARYGSDPWVFVRELLQNARDAGARRVEITASEEGGKQRFTCRDDGCGMTLDEARRYLFALYASSKDDDDAQAGKFGIGFWSVLRFAPSHLAVRSRAAGAPAWEATLDGRLEAAAVADAELADRGTEVVLERRSAGVDFAAEARRAVCHFGRFLRTCPPRPPRGRYRRDDPLTPLTITVNGRRVNAELTLPAPSAAFRGKGFRGVVGLGSEPTVELFAHGLFVRSAASLQDLRRGEERRHTTAEEALAELPSLAPRVLLDSSELDLLLARSDARQDRHLQRMLRAAERALQLLISRQLQALRPQPWYRRWTAGLRHRLAALLGSQRLLSHRFLGQPALRAAVLGALLALPVLWWLRSGVLEAPATERVAAGRGRPQAGAPPEVPAAEGRRLAAESRRAAGAAAAGEGRFHPYSDLARSYRGPHPNRPGDGSALALAYAPGDGRQLFNALVIDRVSDTRWAASPISADAPAYPRVRCRSDCLEMQLLIAAGPGTLRIPLPTGHRLEAASVRLDGAPMPVVETAHGEAALRLASPVRGVLEYRSGPAATVPPRRPRAETAVPGRPLPSPEPPPELAAAAARIRGLPLPDRVREGLRWVAGRIVYDRSPAAARVYRRIGGSRTADGDDFATTALAAGAGDCDVQNALLVELLRLTGVEARLALGYVGFRGTVAPGLHAWVEYRDAAGRPGAVTTDRGWLAADASAVADPRIELQGSPAVAVLPPPGAADPGPPATFPGSRLGAAAILLATVGLAVVVLRRRDRRAPRLDLDPGGDLAALLGGALRHPEAFSALPAMSHGRFVPLLDRSRAISLARARRLASRHRLFRSGNRSSLAREAARRGVPVIDGGTAEGQILSRALGAIDLDHWSALLERSTDSELCGRINRLLESLGERWRVRRVTGLDRPSIELALENLRLGRRLVLVDFEHDEHAPVRGWLPAYPETAAFTALDLILRRGSVGERRYAGPRSGAPARARPGAARILAAAGRRAIEEVDG